MTTTAHEATAPQPDPQPVQQVGQPGAGTPTVVATYAVYAQAEAAVDRLSDAGFPVDGVSIVGRGVTMVETVTGRLTKGRAALAGLGSGVWFGLFVGLLLGLFVPGVAWFGLLLSAVVLGAVWGTVIGFVGHALTGGRRDFSSEQSLRAASYDVTVDGALAAEAGRLLAA